MKIMKWGIYMKKEVKVILFSTLLLLVLVDTLLRRKRTGPTI